MPFAINTFSSVGKDGLRLLTSLSKSISRKNLGSDVETVAISKIGQLASLVMQQVSRQLSVLCPGKNPVALIPPPFPIRADYSRGVEASTSDEDLKPAGRQGTCRHPAADAVPDPPASNWADADLERAEVSQPNTMEE